MHVSKLKSGEGLQSISTQTPSPASYAMRRCSITRKRLALFAIVTTVVMHIFEQCSYGRNTAHSFSVTFVAVLGIAYLCFSKKTKKADSAYTNPQDHNSAFIKDSHKIDIVEKIFNSQASGSLKTLHENDEKSNYFNHQEISELLGPAFISNKNSVAYDRWSGVNDFRPPVSSALNQGISDIVSDYMKDRHPILEIGSGIGYDFSEALQSQIIRTQPDEIECQLLSQATPSPVHQLSIAEIHKRLLEKGKKIPLVFALNVFDTLSSSLRKTSFQQISELQNPGDNILIMLDTNPGYKTIIDHLESLYPENAIYPYFEIETVLDDPAKFAVVIVPLKYGLPKLSIDEARRLRESDVQSLLKGAITGNQFRLNSLQGGHGLKVIILEDFFVEQVKSELQQAGYRSQLYYHASFTMEDRPKDLKSQSDLVYKAVTDKRAIRMWSLSDRQFLANLSSKGLELPCECNEAFIEGLRQHEQQMVGAEILVVEATKN